MTDQDQHDDTSPLDLAHATYRRWLGTGYDLDVLDVVLAVAAGSMLDGDPAWLLVVGGSGAAKTETVAPLAGAGAHVTSTISSAGALLSATPRKETSNDATGGLLRKVGASGVVVLKDFTSILSMSRDPRSEVLAALREVYDGRWERNVGVDGGRSLTWVGRIVLIGAVTTAYDAAHGVIAAMGDRFVLVRMDSSTDRAGSGRQALRNVGREVTMRADLATAVGKVLAAVDPSRVSPLGEDVETLLIDLADVVTRSRTAVERDQIGRVVDAHAPEAPTRLLKQLVQIVRGGLAVGMDLDAAVRVAARAAGDTMPPLRLLVLADVAAFPSTRCSEVTKRVQRPRSTVDRILQELQVLGLLSFDTFEDETAWRYDVAGGIDRAAIDVLFTRYVSKGEGSSISDIPCSDIDGDDGPGRGLEDELPWKDLG